jgi:two-component system NtrC family response regulator
LACRPIRTASARAFATLETILSLKPETKVIVASGHGARESALRAISSGAYDFYQKPVDIDQLGMIVRRAFQLHGIEGENRRLEAQVGDDRTVLGTMITAAPEMLKCPARSSGSPMPRSP